MIKQTVKYVDFNGDEREEKLYFHLSDLDRTRLEAKYITGGYRSLEEYLNGLIAEGSPAPIMEFLEDFILSAYGVRSADGRKFEKTKKIREDFEYSIAYAELFADIFTNQDKMEAFVKGVIQPPTAQPSDKKAPVSVLS